MIKEFFGKIVVFYVCMFCSWMPMAECDIGFRISIASTIVAQLDSEETQEQLFNDVHAYVPKSVLKQISEIQNNIQLNEFLAGTYYAGIDAERQLYEIFEKASSEGIFLSEGIRLKHFYYGFKRVFGRDVLDKKIFDRDEPGFEYMQSCLGFYNGNVTNKVVPEWDMVDFDNNIYGRVSNVMRRMFPVFNGEKSAYLSTYIDGASRYFERAVKGSI